MIVHQQADSTDQWDGTDIEPVYPLRKIKEQEDLAVDEQYAAKYREGDYFS